MRLFAALSCCLLLAAAVVGVRAGDPNLAARQLGKGVKLGQPALSSAAGQSAVAPLSFEPSTAELCPVIAYAVDVQMMEAEALHALSNGPQGKYAADAQANAAADAKPYKIILTPLSYVHNTTVPSVDWVDVHFKINAEGQQSLQMKAVGGSMAHHAKANDMAPMHGMEAMGDREMNSMVGAKFEFAPIMLSPRDTLSFAFTICSNMIDCNTAVHHFRPEGAESHMQPEQQAAMRLQQEQLQRQQQEELKAKQEQQLKAKQELEQQAAHRGAQAAKPFVSEQQAVHKAAKAEGQGEGQAGCPAITYTYKLDCGDSECKASFINLSPDKPLDWVDVHVVKTDMSRVQALMARAASEGPLRVQALADAAVAEIPQQNLAMGLGAGSAGAMSMGMHGSMSSGDMQSMPMRDASMHDAALSSPAHLLKFGASSAPERVLAESRGSQVFQMALPMALKDGDMIGMAFTYCQNGTDCDTEMSFWLLEDDGSSSSSSDPSAQLRLGQSLSRADLSRSANLARMQAPMAMSHQQMLLEREL